MTARLIVDFDRCTGHGRCYFEAEDLLTYDDEGFVTVRHEPLRLADGQIEDAQRAVMACPEQAMRVENEEVNS